MGLLTRSRSDFDEVMHALPECKDAIMEAAADRLVCIQEREAAQEGLREEARPRRFRLGERGDSMFK